MTEPASRLLRRMVTAGWLLVALLLAGLSMPASAWASDCHEQGGHASVEAQAEAAPSPAAIGMTAVAAASGGQESQPHAALPCCRSSGCLTMHTGLSDAEALQMPLRSGRSEPSRSERLADGLGIAPALPPPRTV